MARSKTEWIVCCARLGVAHIAMRWPTRSDPDMPRSNDTMRFLKACCAIGTDSQPARSSRADGKRRRRRRRPRRGRRRRPRHGRRRQDSHGSHQSLEEEASSDAAGAEDHGVADAADAEDHGVADAADAEDHGFGQSNGSRSGLCKI